jgi:DNA-binding MarR family transcriptional regulator
MFGEPAWEMLLLLYIADGEARVGISRLGELAGASKTTALRWLDYLEGQKLIQRDTHPTDRRTVFVGLSDKGRRAIEAYLSGTLPSNE